MSILNLEREWSPGQYSWCGVNLKLSEETSSLPCDMST